MENTRPQTTLLPWQSLLASRQHATNACQAEPHTLGSRVITEPKQLDGASAPTVLRREIIDPFLLSSSLPLPRTVVSSLVVFA